MAFPVNRSYNSSVPAGIQLHLSPISPRKSVSNKKLWIYDLRTNKHFTLKTNPLKREDLDEFVLLYNPANRHDRKPTWSIENPDGRWRAYD